MGSSQSSPITAKGNAAGGRGRKTSSFLFNKQPQSAPHGLTGSVVSFASSEFFKQVIAETVADLTEEPTDSYENAFSDEEEAITDDDGKTEH
jgi:hypothetical protein